MAGHVFGGTKKRRAMFPHPTSRSSSTPMPKVPTPEKYFSFRNSYEVIILFIILLELKETEAKKLIN